MNWTTMAAVFLLAGSVLAGGGEYADGGRAARLDLEQWHQEQHRNEWSRCRMEIGGQQYDFPCSPVHRVPAPDAGVRKDGGR